MGNYEVLRECLECPEFSKSDGISKADCFILSSINPDKPCPCSFCLVKPMCNGVCGEFNLWYGEVTGHLKTRR